MDLTQKQLWSDAQAASRAFFARPHHEKAACVDTHSYAGYIASGEEVTAGVADYSEIFTVTREFETNDARVRAGWPCHGPCPWPDQGMEGVMKRFKERMREEGEKVLGLVEMGLGVQEGALRRYTRDGWHHMRVLRFPARNATNGKGREGRGIGSHTDYGLLVIAAQDEVGGESHQGEVVECDADRPQVSSFAVLAKRRSSSTGRRARPV
jgi:isopenicillin N synthase-like dioxygenase